MSDKKRPEDQDIESLKTPPKEESNIVKDIADEEDTPKSVLEAIKKAKIKNKLLHTKNKILENFNIEIRVEIILKSFLFCIAIFIFFCSYQDQKNILASFKEAFDNKNSVEHYWRALSVVTVSNTAIFVALLFGVFKSKRTIPNIDSATETFSENS